MVATNRRPFPPHWRRNLFPFAFTILLGGGLLYWFTSGPSQEERQRESVCKNWGYGDEKSLARCRKSQAELDAVIAPNFKRARLNSISTFNQELVQQHRTATNETDYASTQLGEISKAVGGAMGFSGKNDMALEGQKVKLAGRVLTQTPDQSEPEADRIWEPQTFEIWGPMPKAENVMPEIVRLDIESLNRDERKFIREHCEMVAFTRCDAVIYGHIGTVEEEKSLNMHYRGVIADEVIITPINPDTPAP